MDKRKYTAVDCSIMFCKMIERSVAADFFACDLQLELTGGAAEYDRLSDATGDPIYYAFFNTTKSHRRQYIKACEQFLQEVE